MKRTSLVLAAIVALPLLAQSKPKTGLVERVDRYGFIQVEANSFNDLTARQKRLAYWLSEASIAIDPIIYDQNSRFGLRQKHILEQIEAHRSGIDPAVMKKSSFAK